MLTTSVNLYLSKLSQYERIDPGEEIILAEKIARDALTRVPEVARSLLGNMKAFLRNLEERT